MYKILIADDEELERKVLKMFITKSFKDSVDVMISPDGTDATIKALVDKPDIIILDVNMPGLNGLEVLEKIRLSGSTSKVIISTAFDEFDYAIKALRLGALDFLVKPVSKSVLLSALNKAIDRIEIEKTKETKIASIDSMYQYIKENSLVKNGEFDNSITIPQAVIKVKEYIENNYFKNIGLDEIVDDCCYSKYHICRLFKCFQNCTIMEYLLRHRITIAKQLLRETNKSVKEIALDIGFNDPNYFSLIFKRELSITPIQYRASKTK